MNGNYQKELEKVIGRLAAEEREEPPRLLLHSCCAPCSSYVLEYLMPYFRITVFYYNPNISEEQEYRKRAEEQKRLIAAYNERADWPVLIREEEYVSGEFYSAVKGMEQCAEGGERCFACYELRLARTAEVAKEGGFDYFATTLTISPLKNAKKLNTIGERLAEKLGVVWLPSDFKKREGYKRSIELSAQYGLYRQDYCGCVYSRLERERQKEEQNGIGHT